MNAVQLSEFIISELRVKSVGRERGELEGAGNKTGLKLLMISLASFASLV